MSRSSPSRSQWKSDEIDVVYEVPMPFEGRNAKINLIDYDSEIEIIISQIPAPEKYHRNYRKQEDEEVVKQHAVARWIVDDAAKELAAYDWNISSHKSHSGNRYLRDVYFTCKPESVDDAIMDAKKFLTNLEEKVLYHSRRFGADLREPPSEKLKSG